ncbi:hypothetical protein FKM82_001402 [Ascaphus truei]|uniref:TRAF-interacting protein with FHA domain-containing protein A n=1 Tax=Ascaphus truei TaxID=8439 RepID=UPI003F59EA21
MSTNDVETEQTLTCLHLRMYHPNQHMDKKIFSSINLSRREEIKADAPVAFGRDFRSCKYVFLSNRASRIQFLLEFFKNFGSTKTSFEIKNMSKKNKLYVDNQELDYLNKIELPPKCIVRFGEFQILVEKEEGESDDQFEICCEVSNISLLQETFEPTMVPIPENGILNIYVSPVEVDENEL